MLSVKIRGGGAPLKKGSTSSKTPGGAGTDTRNLTFPMTVSLIRATGVVPGVSLGWMVVRFVYVIRVPVCARVSLVCPVCVVWVFSPVPVHAPVGKLGMDQWSGACSARCTGVP